jgi:hypothetical protein
VQLADAPVVDPRPELSALGAELVSLLESLREDEWTAPTDAGTWRVKDVALHLLDDDLGWLSRGRDRDVSSLIDVGLDDREFVRRLDAKNERWVAGAAGLSRRVVVDLLRWSAAEVDAYHASLDLHAPSGVRWASAGAVPTWFDLCRDVTERWVHQQHVRDAVGRPADHARHLPLVLRTFVWAFPHQYRVEAPDGTTVAVELGAGGSWTLMRHRSGWELDAGSSASPAATIRMGERVAWRQLTGLAVAPGDVSLDGPEHLVEPLLAVRGIIV